MGCASSTPMITSGSDMLKAATHVAEDAAKSAENAVQDVTQSLGKTLDNAKETVGTAVTGIAHDLGNAFKDKTDEAKNNLLQTLHLNGGGATQNNNATGQLQKQQGLDDGGRGGGGGGGSGDSADDEADDDITQRLSRAPTPTPLAVVMATNDTDSLKTSTPEPEIELALANHAVGDDSPPTPKPNISELERLSAELHEIKTETDVIADAHKSMTSAALMTASNNKNNKNDNKNNKTDNNENAPPNSEKVTNDDSTTSQRRPNTTEWEKYADLLAKNQKFHPNEIALRRRLLGAHGSLAQITTTGLLTTAMKTLGNAAVTTHAPAAANNNSQSITGTTAALPDTVPTEAEKEAAAAAAAEAAISTLTAASAAAAAAAMTTKNVVPKITPPQYFRDFTRPKDEPPRASQFDDESGQSDRNNEGGSTSSSTQQAMTLRSNTRVLRHKKQRTFNNTSLTVKKMHRQLTSLIGGMLPVRTAALVSSAGYRNPYTTAAVHFLPNHNQRAGRNFDFNPARMRMGSPPLTTTTTITKRKRNATTLLPSLRQYSSNGNPTAAADLRLNGLVVNTPIKLNAIRQERSRNNHNNKAHIMTNTPPHVQLIPSSSSTSTTTSRIGLHSFGGQLLNSPISVTPIMKNNNHNNSPKPKPKHKPNTNANVSINNRSLSRSSRSSTNNSITLKSNCTTPISRSTSKNSLHNFTAIAALDDVTEILDDSHLNEYTANGNTLFESPPVIGVIRGGDGEVDDFLYNGNGCCIGSGNGIGCSNVRKSSISSTTHSPMELKNTSSFLSSPRNSPFTTRKSYDVIYENHLNGGKNVFIADLSSINENRNLLTPSPYKIRERCAVCYKKYNVK